MDHRRNLIQAIRDTPGVIKRVPAGELFTLKSGKQSNFYIDLRQLSISPVVRHMVALLQRDLEDLQFDAVGGPSIGADPIVGAYLASDSPLLRGFLIRKEEKGHGLAGLVIGSARPGDRVVILEDVSTTGGSMLQAVEAVRHYGCTVARGVAVLDRSDGTAARALLQVGVPYRSLLTHHDLEMGLQ